MKKEEFNECLMYVAPASHKDTIVEAFWNNHQADVGRRDRNGPDVERYSSTYDFLNDAFSWSSAPEGGRFWEDMADALSRVARNYDQMVEERSRCCPFMGHTLYCKCTKEQAAS